MKKIFLLILCLSTMYPVVNAGRVVQSFNDGWYYVAYNDKDVYKRQDIKGMIAVEIIKRYYFQRGSIIQQLKDDVRSLYALFYRVFTKEVRVYVKCSRRNRRMHLMRGGF